MGEVMSYKKAKQGKMLWDVDWAYTFKNKDGVSLPYKIWENLESLLQHQGIQVRLNEINHEIDYYGLDGSAMRNGKVSDIHSLQVRAGLNMPKADVEGSIKRIAEKHSYNPFVDMLKANKNNRIDLITKVFSCLKINKDFDSNYGFYETLFTKWCLNVVKMAHNTLENNWGSQGVIVLQGGQGTYKSTFFRKLLPNNKWFKGDETLSPGNKDNEIKNTSYILVELGELDSTLKGEQAKLKQFLTATNDELRSPYEKFSEKYARKTSYAATVNKVDFLKDETGSRRFWVIPVEYCDIKQLEEINMFEFWGAVYTLWLDGSIEDYLTKEENNQLAACNSRYNFETDVTITLKEGLRWNEPEDRWTVYNVKELANGLFIKEKKSIKIELQKMGFEYKTHRIDGKVKTGFLLPHIIEDYIN